MGKAMKVCSKSRKCGACGKVGHNILTCPTKAATIIRNLRSKLAMKKLMKQRKPKRMSPQKTGKHRAQARNRYTMKSGPSRRKVARRLTKAQRKGKGLLGRVGGDSKIALGNMEEAGYAKVPKRCLDKKCRGKLGDLFYRGRHLWRRTNKQNIQGRTDGPRQSAQIR